MSSCNKLVNGKFQQSYILSSAPVRRSSEAYKRTLQCRSMGFVLFPRALNFLEFLDN